MGASKKRQTIAKHARERAVRERRALKLEKKRRAALGLVDEAERATEPSQAEPETAVRLVPAEAGDVPAAGSPESNGGAHAVLPPTVADERGP